MSNLPTWAGAEMIRMEDEHSVSMYASSKDAEIARLSVRAAQAEADLMLMRRDRDAYHASMMKAEAENERLREALDNPEDSYWLSKIRETARLRDAVFNADAKLADRDAEIARLRDDIRLILSARSRGFGLDYIEGLAQKVLRGESD
jgi:UDP-N-acetylmuramyl tripeptide synthase